MGRLRWCIPNQLAAGEYGAIVNWFHLECGKLDAILVGYAKMGDDKLTKMVLGWDGLQKDEWLGKIHRSEGAEIRCLGRDLRTTNRGYSFSNGRLLEHDQLGPI